MVIAFSASTNCAEFADDLPSMWERADSPDHTASVRLFGQIRPWIKCEKKQNNNTKKKKKTSYSLSVSRIRHAIMPRNSSSENVCTSKQQMCASNDLVVPTKKKPPLWPKFDGSVFASYVRFRDIGPQQRWVWNLTKFWQDRMTGSRNNEWFGVFLKKAKEVVGEGGRR